jgi:hypothetical protein
MMDLVAKNKELQQKEAVWMNGNVLVIANH